MATFASSLRRYDVGDVREHPVAAAVAGITALALLVRLYALGWRMAHQDEARVGYAVIRYVRTGTWEYNPILHGPFVFQVNAPLFDLFGAGDFTGRLVVALVGGLLPATAWLFRTRLRDAEVAALAGLLALNPFLVYYSRFMRSDVLVAAFAFATVGFAVRLLDTRDRRYLYAAAAALALGFTTKENILVYLGIWVGSAGLVVDYRLFVARVRASTDTWADYLIDQVDRAARQLFRWRVPVLLALVEFLVIIVAFYAPRPDIWQALTDPTMLPGVVAEATVGSWEKLWTVWVGGSENTVDQYVTFLKKFVGVLRHGALVTIGFAAVGFLVDRYAAGGQRDLVAFATYWGAVSVLLYPRATDIMAPWLGVHVVVPLAVPAAVGIGMVIRKGAAGLVDDDAVSVGLAALILLLATAQVGATAYSDGFQHAQDDTPMVQYGQPDDHFTDEIRTIDRVAARNEGIDVLFYGDHFSTRLFRQPFPWYLAAAGVETAATEQRIDVVDGPPVVIAPSDDSAGIEDTIGDIESALEGYRRIGKVAIVLEIPGNEVYASIYVRESALAAIRTPRSAPTRALAPRTRR